MKKAVLTVLAALLITALAGIAYAGQIDGMVSGAPGTIALPTDLVTSVNPGGLGDSLIYGYYNVRNNLNIINLVNTSSVDGVKARVIFRNAKNSKECLDFNVCLSRGDTWTAYLADGGSTAVIYDDAAFTSLTGIDKDTWTSPLIPTTGQLFKPGTYLQPYGPTITVTGDDCKEGYFEIVGLTRIPHYDKNSSDTESLCTTSLAGNANCIRTVNACEAYTASGTAYDVGNVLMGNNDIVDLSANLVSFSYNATAFADTTDVAWALTGGLEGSVVQAMSTRSTRVVPASECRELDYLLTKRHVMSSYDLSGLLGEAEFILTFPTRFVCHNWAIGEQNNIFNGSYYWSSILVAYTPFYEKYCTYMTPNLWNHKEQKPTTSLDFSPSPQTTFCVPNEVNVIRLGNSNIWNSTVVITLSSNNYLHGWIDFDLLAGNSVVGGNTVYHETAYGTTVARYAEGLPVLALTTQTYVNGRTGYIVPMQYSSDIRMTTTLMSP